MISNYLKIALRFLLKNRSFSIVNIFGLTLGFACFILITLYLHDELTFDMFHHDAAHIYRVIQHEKMEDGSTRNVAPVAARIAPEMMKQLPETQDVIRISALGRVTMGNDPANRAYERLLTADANFFTFFNFPLAAGDPVNALKEPDRVVISEALAKRYFPNGDAMGKRIWTSMTRNDQPIEVIVSGIMKPFPKHSHLQFDILFSESTWATVFPWYTNFMNSDWSSNAFITYIKTKDNIDQKNFEQKISGLVRSNYSGEKPFNSTFTLQPLKDVHLYSEGIQGNDVNANGLKPFYLYMFSGVAVLILLIACLNYMNLSTAAAYKRTREIGTRKTLGALKSQLITQFTGEALVLAITAVQVLVPYVNAFTEKELALGNLSWDWIAIIAAAVIFSGIVSALYPAFIISRVRPAEALKKDVRVGNRALPVRKLLVVAQFVISIMMIASTLVVYRQLRFIQTKDLGFQVDNLLVIDINSDPLRRNFETVKSEFANIPEVLSISTSTRVPGEWKTFPIATANVAGSSESRESIFVGIDNDFLSTYQIKLLEGRNFVAGSADSTKILLTELAVKDMGLTNPIGQIIEIPKVRWGGSINQLDRTFRAEVIGVVEDFHFESFRQAMMPLIFAAPNTPIQRIDYYTMRVRTSDWPSTIDKLRAVNNKIDPNNPLEYTFLDKTFENFYKADVKRGQTFLAFSGIIVLIACMGLFALVSYSIESRTKEIGIRKVLGASVNSIVRMISTEFLALVIIACVVGIPIAWYLMNQWLSDFAYRIPMTPGIFISAASIAVIIALLTISLRSIRAAIANPVNSLRNE